MSQMVKNALFKPRTLDFVREMWLPQVDLNVSIEKLQHFEISVDGKISTQNSDF
jgi:hypothetical protein